MLACLRGGQKIPLDNKLPDLGVQLLDLDRIGRSRIGPSPCKRRHHVLNRRSFPHADLGRVYAVFLRQLRRRHLFVDRLKRNLGLELGRMVLSLRHLGSCLSSGDPSLQLVRNPATTSKGSAGRR